MIDERDVLSLSPDERHRLQQILREAEAPMLPPVGRAAARRAALLTLLVTSVAALLGWIVVLGASLPSTSVTHGWRVSWVGLDIAEAIALTISAWAAWRARHLLIPAALITGTLLLCDAWFDVVLSWNTSGWLVSVLSAAFVELPMAAVLWWVAFRLVRYSLLQTLARLGVEGPAPRLRDLPLFGPIDSVAARVRPGAPARPQDIRPC